MLFDSGPATGRRELNLLILVQTLLRPACSKLCVGLPPEALLACAPLGRLWKLQPAFVSLFRTQPLGKGAQSCADCENRKGIFGVTEFRARADTRAKKE
jgi:hypothetical protein